MNTLHPLLRLTLLALAFHLAAPAPASADGLAFGPTYVGAAKSTKSGKSWMFEVNFDRLDERKPEVLWGQLAWPSLKSAHILDARLAGDRLSFVEKEAAEKGRAHLGVKYEGRIAGDRVEGTWKDPAGDRGTFYIELTEGGGGLRALGMFARRPFTGEAKSSKSGKSWPFTLTLDGERATELIDYDGTLEWPTLGSRHRVVGLYKYGRLEFKETEALRRGKAHLGVTYVLWRDGNGLTGTYVDPKGDRGTVAIPLE